MKEGEGRRERGEGEGRGGRGREKEEEGGEGGNSRRKNAPRSKLMVCHGRMRYRTSSGTTVNSRPHMHTMNRNFHLTRSKVGSG